MRLRHRVSLLDSPLKLAASRTAASSLCNRCRRYASSAAYPEKIAVLGGGISGLASAYFINKEFPNSKITVHEANKDSGGWIQSRRVAVPGGDVLFEYGPRTLRPGKPALVTAQMIQDLDLVDSVLFTNKNAPGAKNRYIYYPDRLQKLPGNEPPSFWHLYELWKSGILAGAHYLVGEAFIRQRPATLKDESIGSFVERRIDRRVANNFISPVFHGIYAGDIWQLSARTLLAQAWMMEGLHGSITNATFMLHSEQPQGFKLIKHPYDADLGDAIEKEVKIDEKFEAQLKQCAMFTFKNGMSTLVRTLQKKLQENGQVDFKFGSWIKDYKKAQEGQQIEVTTGTETSPSTENYDLVVSTLRNSALTPYVTVMTVNLYFPNSNLIPQKGFGYLIPQSIAFEQNPERALGVIFDSDAISGQDSAEGTKLTVMLGGHYWDGWAGYPSDAEGYELALSVVRRHLNIKEEPTHHNVNLSKDCIPQYTVGYEDRLRAYAGEVRDKFKGKVRIVGSQTHGVGVNDCIRAAWAMARDLRGVGWKGNSTGIERVHERYDSSGGSNPYKHVG